MNIDNPFLLGSSSLFEKSKFLKTFLKVFNHFFGSINEFFNEIEDPRLERSDNYPLASLFLTGIIMFVARVQSVRQVKHMMNTEHSRATFKTLFHVSSVPHGSTISKLFAELDSDQIELLPSKMIKTLLKKKVLNSRKFLGKYLPIAVDGTGLYKFPERHCEHCLTRKSKKTGKMCYYHMVLEAKVVTRDGLALSIMSEFIENSQENPTKQDCETKAFYRLAEKLKREFPKQPIILIGDGLFAEGPIFQACLKHKWEYIIVLKDKDLLSVNQEFRNLKVLHPENTKVIRKDDVLQKYYWCSEIHYKDTQKRDYKLNVLECREKKDGKETKYQWLSSILINSGNLTELSKTGRSRWVIENQGFNTQKNLGFALEHPYSKDSCGMKVYYYLLQIAHIWVQLCERGSLLKEVVTEKFGALKNLAFYFLEDFRNAPLNTSDWITLQNMSIQIRLAEAPS